MNSNIILHFVSTLLLVCISFFFCGVILSVTNWIASAIAIKTVGRYSKHKVFVQATSIGIILVLLGSATYLVW